MDSNTGKNLATTDTKVQRSSAETAPGQQRQDDQIAIQPLVDIFEDAHGIMVVAEMPGVSKDRLNVQADRNSGVPAMSQDGRFVVFESLATNLIPGGTDGTREIYVRDRQNGTTQIVSVATGGAIADGACFGPTISSDGRYVAFASNATNLDAGDTNDFRDVFVRDLQAGTTEIVSTAPGGAPGDNECGVQSEISGDGRHVAFTSYASNLVAGDTNAARDVFVRDRQTGATVCASVSAVAPG